MLLFFPLVRNQHYNKVTTIIRNTEVSNQNAPVDKKIYIYPLVRQVIQVEPITNQICYYQEVPFQSLATLYLLDSNYIILPGPLVSQELLYSYIALSYIIFQNLNSTDIRVLRYYKQPDISIYSSIGTFPRLYIEYYKLLLRLEPSSLISTYLSITILIISLSFSFSLLRLAPFLLLLQLIIVSSFSLFFLLFILGFALAILQSLFPIRISNISHYSRLLLSISPFQLGFPFRLPVGLYTALLLLLLSVISISIPSIQFVVFTVLSIIYSNRGRKLYWLKLQLPISNSPSNIYTGFLGQYRFIRSLAFTSSIYAVSFL